MTKSTTSWRRGARIVLTLGVLGGLIACGPAQLPPGDTIADVDEAQNREIFEFNQRVDRALVRPTASAYGDAVPQPVQTVVGNFASNLSQPGYVVNDILQLQFGDALQNTLRFAVNSTLGIGGIFDPASAMGLTAEASDFGQTLHTMGVSEGDYMILPLSGPTTTRDALGAAVDTVMNPLRHIVDLPDDDLMTAVRIGAALGQRDAIAETLDPVIDASEDSYLQLRSIYLQNRRFELLQDDLERSGGALSAVGENDVDDPYFDPYQ